MTSSLSTGEFDPGIANRPWGNTATAFNGQLWVIGAGGGDQIYQTRFTFNGNSGEWDLTNSNNWSNTKVAVQGQDYISSHDKCGSDALGDGSALYLFWNGGDFIGGESTQGTPATGEPMWQFGFAMQDSSGNMFTPPKPCDISAVAYGSDSFLPAFPIEQSNAPAIFIGLYSVSGQQTQSSVETSQGSFVPWPAQAQAIITCDMLNGYPQNGGNNPTIVDVGKSISVTWFASSPASGGDPQVLVMAALTATLKAEPHNTSWPVQLMLPIDPNSGAPLPPGAPTPWVFYDDQYPGSPFFTVKDPANRVICYATGGEVGNQAAIERWQYPTWSIPTGAPPTARDVTVNHSDDYSPAVAFYIDTANPIQPTPPTTTTNPDGSILAYNVYRFLFYNAGHIYAQASYYGMIEQMPTQILQPDQIVTSMLVNGIIDSPFPQPLANVQNFQFESDNPNMGALTYTTASGATTGYTQSVSGAGGLHTEGVSAVGLAWNITLQGGGQSTWGTLTTTTVTQVLQQNAIVNTDNQTKVGIGVNPNAGFIASSPGLSQVPYRFADDTVKPPNYIGYPYSESATDQAPRVSLISVAQILSTIVNYTPYMVTPGDLASYTPEGINATMSGLYSTAGWDAPTDYFQDVLLPNAFDFPINPQTSLPYLEFQLTSNTPQQDSFNRLVQNNKTWGWNTSVSAFVGFRWNATILGEEISQGNIGAQVNFSAQGNWEDDTTNDLGIQISNLQFPVWGDNNAKGWADAVCNYIMLLLYLPPPSGPDPAPTLWADELRQFGTKTFSLPTVIDEGSEPWRIAFVVIAYQTNQNIGVGWDYYYKGNLPGLQPPRAPL
jgi:hypothetical protein